MNSEQLNLVFTGISAVCAVIGVVFSIISIVNKRKVTKVKNVIETAVMEYREKTIKIEDLMVLEPLAEKLQDIIKEFNKVSTKKVPKKGEKKEERDYYADIKINLGEILSNIPKEYEKLIDYIDNANKALSYCIVKKITFDMLGKFDEYSYGYVEDNLQSAKMEINSIIRSLKYS